MARYAYRWMPYQVSYDSRRRAARIELTAIATKSTPLTSAIRTYGYVVMSVQNSTTTLVRSSSA